MAARANNHVGLLVSDLERSVRFYVEGLGARQLTLPVLLKGRASEIVMGAPPGARYRMTLLGLEVGGVELFSFEGEAVPDWAAVPTTRRLPHLCVEVDDVPATLARVEAAGGRRLWDDVLPWGTRTVIYVADPDGNTIELIDAGLDGIVGEAFKMFPDCEPPGPG